MRVLVTGATGFLGAAVVRHLRHEGHETWAAERAPTSPSRPGMERIQLDLSDRDRIEAVVKQVAPEAIVHCAALGTSAPERDFVALADVTITATLALHAAARRAGVARFIHIGTAFEYGPHDAPVDESTPCNPLGAYAVAKAAASSLLMSAATMHGLPPVVLRLFNLFGPGDKPGRLGSDLVACARSGNPLALSAGAQRRNFMFVEDAARVVSALLGLAPEQNPAGRVLNVGFDDSCTVREFAERFARELGISALLRFGERTADRDKPHHLYSECRAFAEFCRASGLTHLLTKTPLDRAAAQCLGSS
ncbi:MAG TPA: NAD(P)-dependent oxidoreductase [Polyangiaceae bacterium]|nr:NAD(P)-dependent oxidoreductase [Polyangiaceae bacterium]